MNVVIIFILISQYPLLSLVLICRRHTWDMAAGTAWDNAAAYVNIYRQHIICPRHWPPACLQSWAEFNFSGKPAVVGDENILCEHHLRRSADAKYGVTIPFFPQFLIFKVTHEAFRASLGTSVRRGPTGTDGWTLSVVTGDYVAGRSAGCENQALSISR